MENSYGAYSFEESRLEKETDKILNYENIVVKIDTILMSIE
jgi:aspartate-semialdehyde dehydrogenase